MYLQHVFCREEKTAVSHCFPSITIFASFCVSVPFPQLLTAFQLSLWSAFLFLFSSSRLFFLSLSTFFQLCSVPLPLFKQYLPPKRYSSSHAIVSPLFSLIFWSCFSQSAFYYQLPNLPYWGRGRVCSSWAYLDLQTLLSSPPADQLSVENGNDLRIPPGSGEVWQYRVNWHQLCTGFSHLSGVLQGLKMISAVRWVGETACRSDWTRIAWERLGKDQFGTQSTNSSKLPTKANQFPLVDLSSFVVPGVCLSSLPFSLWIPCTSFSLSFFTFLHCFPHVHHVSF